AARAGEPRDPRARGPDRVERGLPLGSRFQRRGRALRTRGAARLRPRRARDHRGGEGAACGVLPARARPPRWPALHRPHQPPQARAVRAEAQEGGARGRRRLAGVRRAPAAPARNPSLSQTPLRLLFFGTPDFAVPSLRRLAAGPDRVVAAVSQPDRPRGRGRKRSASPVAAEAERLGIAALRTESVGEPAFVAELAALEPRLRLVVAFGP